MGGLMPAFMGWDSEREQHFRASSAEATVGRVVTRNNYGYVVLNPQGEWQARLKGQDLYRHSSAMKWPVVGDWVEMLCDERHGTAKILRVLPRRSLFVRRGAGKATVVQAMLANIDIIFVLTTPNAEFSTRRLERYVSLVEDSGAEPVLVLNKADLIPDRQAYLDAMQAVAPKRAAIEISAQTGYQVDRLFDYLWSGLTGALLGSSGVGKSTLMNYMLADARQAIQSIRSSDAKGRHTTTRRELFVLPNGSMLVDNPGLRELQLWIQKDGLRNSFEDIESTARQCQFRNCSHQSEPGCAVRAAIDQGRLSEERLLHFQKLIQEETQRTRKVQAQSSKSKVWFKEREKNSRFEREEEA